MSSDKPQLLHLKCHPRSVRSANAAPCSLGHLPGVTFHLLCAKRSLPQLVVPVKCRGLHCSVFNVVPRHLFSVVRVVCALVAGVALRAVAGVVRVTLVAGVFGGAVDTPTSAAGAFRGFHLGGVCDDHRAVPFCLR